MLQTLDSLVRDVDAARPRLDLRDTYWKLLPRRTMRRADVRRQGDARVAVPRCTSGELVELGIARADRVKQLFAVAAQTPLKDAIGGGAHEQMVLWERRLYL